jgi:hypothetical protein
LVRQQLNANDDETFFDDMLPFLKDDRYIRIDGRPLLIVYRPHFFTKDRMRAFSQVLRNKAEANGLGGLYLVTALTHSFDASETPSDWGFDAAVEFPPHGLGTFPKRTDLTFVDEWFNGMVFDMGRAIREKRYQRESSFELFRTVFPSWDNTARKAYSGAQIFQTTPEEYKAWLVDMLQWTIKNKSRDKQYLFVNAWNEWAEGAHLEPDQRYGYAYLQATREGLEQLTKDSP